MNIHRKIILLGEGINNCLNVIQCWKKLLEQNCSGLIIAAISAFK